MRRPILCFFLCFLTIGLELVSVFSQRFFNVDLDRGFVETSEITIRISSRKPIFVISHNRDRLVSFRIVIESLVEFEDRNLNGRYDSGEALNIVDLRRTQWYLNYSIISRNGTTLLLLDLKPEKTTGKQGYEQRSMVPLHIRLLISSSKMNVRGLTLNGTKEVLVNLTFSRWRWHSSKSKLALIIRYGAARGSVGRHCSGKKDSWTYIRMQSEATLMSIAFSADAEFDDRTESINIDLDSDSTKLVLPRYEEYGEAIFIFGLKIFPTGTVFSASETYAMAMSIAIVVGLSLLCSYLSNRELKKITKVIS